MRASILSHLTCPECQQALTLHGSEEDGQVFEGELSCPAGRRFLIRDGIPNLVYPEALLPSDLEFQQKYDQGAADYEHGLEWLFASFFEDQDATRRGMVDLLELRPNARVLDLGGGTGQDSRHIAERLSGESEIWLLELSRGMIEIARQKLSGSPVPMEYFLGNGSYLPFADATFDALFHFGGLNVFGDRRRALKEMTRVVKVGAKVVVGDESVAPWLRRKLYGRILVKANPMYRHRPAVAELPENAEAVCLRWVLGNAFWLIDYRVGRQPPRLNLDLTIPGKRGGTLRSRYYGPGVGKG